MAEYIDRSEYCEKHCRCSNEYCDRQSCPIWRAPAADAVPVVRCGGCEFSLSYCGYLVSSLSARSRNPKANYIVNPDFFCAHGKRKEAT